MAALLAACGSTTLGRNVDQELQVETPDCPAARCELRNDRGTWVVAATPARVVVTTSARPLDVRCRHAGGVEQAAHAGASQRPIAPSATTAGAVAGGTAGAVVAAPAFAFGGPFAVLGATAVLIGAAGGAGVARAADASDRAWHYPDRIVVPLQCPPAVAAAGPAAPWGLQVRAAVDGDGAPPGAVWVREVSTGGPADQAGLRVGDLLVAVDGRPLAGTLGLEEALWMTRARVVDLQVRRAGTPLTLGLVVGARP